MILFFLMIWTVVWPQLLTNLTINNKIPIFLINGLLCTTIFLSWNILELRNAEKNLGAHIFGHLVFTGSKIFNIVFTTPFWGISDLTSLNIESCFKENLLRSINTTEMNILEMYLKRDVMCKIILSVMSSFYWSKLL